MQVKVDYLRLRVRMVQILALSITMHANTTVSKSILSLQVQLFFLNTTELRLFRSRPLFSVIRGQILGDRYYERPKRERKKDKSARN